MTVRFARFRCLAAAAAWVLLGACASQRPVPDLDLSAARFPPVAAEYRTTRTFQDGKREQSTQTRWRLWRDIDRIVTENLSAHTGEVWQRDGAVLFQQRLFHDDRKSVDYQMDDLRLGGADLSWPHQSLLISPELLDRLHLKSAEWRANYPYRRYVGEVNGAAWDITLRMDRCLPVIIQRIGGGTMERTELLAVHELSAAPWAPVAATDYEHIDFTDLGDRQDDPFVARVQDQLGRPHTH